jgi:glucokinase
MDYKIHKVKPTLEKILSTLGFKSINDLQTVISSESFESLDDLLIQNLVKEYQLHLVDDILALQKPLTGERKFEITNRVLELYHQMIIDSVKDVDELLTVSGRKVYGYRLELMPAGY